MEAIKMLSLLLATIIVVSFQSAVGAVMEESLSYFDPDSTGIIFLGTLIQIGTYFVPDTTRGSVQLKEVGVNFWGPGDCELSVVKRNLMINPDSVLVSTSIEVPYANFDWPVWQTIDLSGYTQLDSLKTFSIILSGNLSVPNSATNSSHSYVRIEPDSPVGPPPSGQEWAHTIADWHIKATVIYHRSSSVQNTSWGRIKRLFD